MPDETSLQAPDGLICELLSHPESTVITNPQPSFGWVVKDRRRGAVQSAYQIKVSSSSFVQDADLWDSGKVQSDRSINVLYGGTPLPFDSACWWVVRTWDADDRPGPWSKSQKYTVTKQLSAAYYADEWRHTARGDVRANRHPLEVNEVEPKEIVAKGQGSYFIDFGKAAFGTIALELYVESVCKIGISLGEKRIGDAVDPNPGGSIVYLHSQLQLIPGTHKYKLDLPIFQRGMPMPKHIGEVAPFRYCEITDCPARIDASCIRQLAVWYRFDDKAASFVSSDPTLNDIWELCKYSIKATSFLGIYVDGQRERLPYEADAYINQLGHYYTDREFAMARYTHEHLITHPTWPTEWILFSVLIAWEDYLYTGNPDSIERFYDDLAAKTLTSLAREDGLISTRTGLMTEDVLKSIHFNGKLRDIVDWPHGSETDGFDFVDVNTVVNAFHYRAISLMAKMADVIGRKDDADKYRKRADKVHSAINEKLFDRAKGVYVDGEGSSHCSLHANMFALAFGLAGKSKKASVIKFIKAKGMACSVYGAQFLLEALYRAGEDAAALDLMTNSSERSWPHMIYNLGTTITLEAWDAKYKPNLDWNHAWGAAPANIIPRFIVGVEPIEPGFSKFRIKPNTASLRNLDATVPIIRGTVKVSVRVDESQYRLNCTIPANTSAEVHIPALDVSQVSEGDQPIVDNNHVQYVCVQDGRAVLRVRAGSYSFSTMLPHL